MTEILLKPFNVIIGIQTHLVDIIICYNVLIGIQTYIVDTIVCYNVLCRSNLCSTY